MYVKAMYMMHHGKKGEKTQVWASEYKHTQPQKRSAGEEEKRELKDSSAAASFPLLSSLRTRKKEKEKNKAKTRNYVTQSVFPDSKRRESLFEIGPNDTMTFPLYRSRGVFFANRCPPRRKENGGGGGAKRMCKSQFLGAGKGNRFKHIFYIKKFPKQRHIHINYSVLCNLFQVLCSLVGRILYQTMKKALVTFSSSFDG